MDINDFLPQAEKANTNEEVVAEKKSSDLFEFLPKIFQKDGWQEVSDSEKKKHCFMIQRILSIKYPKQAQFFNQLHTNPVAIVDVWHMIMSRQFSSAPSWTYNYSKTNKKKVVEKVDKKATKKSAEVIKTYKERYQLSNADYDALMEFFPDEVNAELKMLEEYA